MSIQRAILDRVDRVEFPEKLRFLFYPMRYKIAYGGRGGAKSWGFTRALLLKAVVEKIRVLCAREFQVSIQESVHKLFKNQISLMNMESDFGVTQNSIVCPGTGSDFFFYGLKNNPSRIKSTEGIDICWVEEAERVSEESWQVLIPTIRKDDSEIWVSFNPNEETDPTYKRFIINPPPNSVVREIGWQDNPWFPEELRKEKDYLARVDIDAYLHIYEGKCRKRSQARVLGDKWMMEAFEPGADWKGPYQGADWGFAEDPTVLIRCWIHNNRLWIEYEVWQIGLETDLIPDAFDVMPKAREYVTRADNARPETISYLQRHGYKKMIGVKKGPGSVEDGISVLRSFEKIVIHPRCTHARDEAGLWSYKTDPLTGDVLPKLIEKHDHTWDAVRYALEPAHTAMLEFMAAQHKEAEEKRKESAEPPRPA